MEGLLSTGPTPSSLCLFDLESDKLRSSAVSSRNAGVRGLNTPLTPSQQPLHFFDPVLALNVNVFVRFSVNCPV